MYSYKATRQGLDYFAKQKLKIQSYNAQSILNLDEAHSDVAYGFTYATPCNEV
ncbi:hypothetical protein AGMMS50233_09990 [Endomicrobiia bacterium]|nr:hypothetical protein AGMMS50233_09990 [Endomicrobiia bacterium]